ncbi:2068_t:CDS:2, partial [Cetraspora pellucida]
MTSILLRIDENQQNNDVIASSSYLCIENASVSSDEVSSNEISDDEVSEVSDEVSKVSDEASENTNYKKPKDSERKSTNESFLRCAICVVTEMQQKHQRLNDHYVLSVKEMLCRKSAL